MSVNINVTYLTAYDGRNEHPQIFMRMALMCVYDEDKMKVKMTMMMMVITMMMMMMVMIMTMTMMMMIVSQKFSSPFLKL